MKYWPSYGGLCVGEYKFTADISFDEEDIWPQTVKISLDMRDGVLRVFSDDVMYARLNKQHDTTNVAKLLSSTETDDSQ
jgi:hypothetical protein